VGKWRVTLEGDPSNLEWFAAHLSASPLRVIADATGCFLEAKDLDELDDPTAVHATSMEIVDVLNAIARLDNPSFRPVRAGAVCELDRGGEPARTYVVLEPATLSAAGTVYRPAIINSGGKPPCVATESSRPVEWMRVARKSPHVRRALSLWNGEQSPLNLWKVYELVREYSGLDINHVIGKEKHNQLRRSLNDPHVAGEQARHEVFRPPRGPVRPLPLPEAAELIGTLLKRWLDELLGAPGDRAGSPSVDDSSS
jgi:hypothetical protein